MDDALRFPAFSLFFLCCEWWKKVVYSKYHISPDFYEAVGKFLKNNPNIRRVRLTVCDNRFNIQKARLLRDGLAETNIVSLRVTNVAHPFDLGNK